ncbi:MAG: hypothetical protein U5K37_12455 [Natrialbaceae archaeon]|nr:hypothetical protein [Natrialbaceae archaeon]
MFEEATATVFQETFNLEGTNLLGQGASGIVADGEVQQGEKWLLWDNKRRTGNFKLGSDPQSKIINYIEQKRQQHQVEWFLIIAPSFASSAGENAVTIEKRLGIDIRLITAGDFKALAETWRERFAAENRELPLSIFYGSEEFNLEASTGALVLIRSD